MITIDPESLGPEAAPQETLTQEISRNARGAGRVIVDLATASGATTRRVLRLAPTVLVPVVPDMSSVVSVSSIDSLLPAQSSARRASRSGLTMFSTSSTRLFRCTWTFAKCCASNSAIACCRSRCGARRP